jgi:hypothetical protein
MEEPNFAVVDKPDRMNRRKRVLLDELELQIEKRRLNRARLQRDTRKPNGRKKATDRPRRQGSW